jgi:hypothetical protein
MLRFKITQKSWNYMLETLKLMRWRPPSYWLVQCKLLPQFNNDQTKVDEPSAWMTLNTMNCPNKIYAYKRNNATLLTVCWCMILDLEVVASHRKHSKITDRARRVQWRNGKFFYPRHSSGAGHPHNIKLFARHFAEIIFLWLSYESLYDYYYRT